MNIPSKDPDRPDRIADVLRAPPRAVVEAWSAGDYAWSAGVPMVDPPDAETARRVREYIEDYGQGLEALPEEAWSSSHSAWEGDHWMLHVDLWTKSGRSDMVLAARAREEGAGYRVNVMGVYVP